MHIKSRFHKIVLGLTGVSLALGGVFFTPPGQSMLATLYKITLTSGSTEANPETIIGSERQDGWSERFHIYQENETSWKLSYPTPGNTDHTSFEYFSESEIQSMIDGVKISKTILGESYLFYIEQFPAQDMDPYPKAMFSEIDGKTYGITANTSNASLDPYITDFNNAVGGSASANQTSNNTSTATDTQSQSGDSGSNNSNSNDDNNVSVATQNGVQCGTEAWSCVNGYIQTNTNLQGNVKESEYTWICTENQNNGETILCSMPHGKVFQENNTSVCGNDFNVPYTCVSGECTKNESFSFYCGNGSELVSNPDPVNNPQSWTCENATTVTTCRPLTAFEYGYLGSTSYPLSHSSISEFECRRETQEERTQYSISEVCRLKNATVSESISKALHHDSLGLVLMESFSPEDRNTIEAIRSALASGNYSEGMSIPPSGNDLACGEKMGECFNGGGSNFGDYNASSNTTSWQCSRQNTDLSWERIECSTSGNQAAICPVFGKYTCDTGTPSEKGLVFSSLYKDLRYQWKCTGADGGYTRDCEGQAVPSTMCGTLEVNKCKSVTISNASTPTTLHFTPTNEVDLSNGNIQWSCKSQEYPEWETDCIEREPVCSRITSHMCQSGFTVNNIDLDSGTWSCESQQDTSVSINCNSI